MRSPQLRFFWLFLVEFHKHMPHVLWHVLMSSCCGRWWGIGAWSWQVCCLSGSNLLKMNGNSVSQGWWLSLCSLCQTALHCWYVHLFVRWVVVGFGKNCKGVGYLHSMWKCVSRDLQFMEIPCWEKIKLRCCQVYITSPDLFAGLTFAG